MMAQFLNLKILAYYGMVFTIYHIFFNLIYVLIYIVRSFSISNSYEIIIHIPMLFLFKNEDFIYLF